MNKKDLEAWVEKEQEKTKNIFGENFNIFNELSRNITKEDDYLIRKSLRRGLERLYGDKDDNEI